MSSFLATFKVVMYCQLVQSISLPWQVSVFFLDPVSFSKLCYCVILDINMYDEIMPVWPNLSIKKEDQILIVLLKFQGQDSKWMVQGREVS